MLQIKPVSKYIGQLATISGPIALRHKVSLALPLLQLAAFSGPLALRHMVSHALPLLFTNIFYLKKRNNKPILFTEFGARNPLADLYRQTELDKNPKVFKITEILHHVLS